MSLEELKNDWDSLDESTSQHKIPNEQITSILKSKYRSFMNKVFMLEILMLLLYLYFMVLIIFRFDELKIDYLEILGIISLVILGLLFVLRLIKLKHTFYNRFLNDTHSAALKKIAEQKIRIQKFYLANIILGFFLTVILIILSIKIYNEYDLIQSNIFWLTMISSSFIFVFLMNKWIKKSYMKVIGGAEDLLQELE